VFALDKFYEFLIAKEFDEKVLSEIQDLEYIMSNLKQNKPQDFTKTGVNRTHETKVKFNKYCLAYLDLMHFFKKHCLVRQLQTHLEGGFKD